MEETVPAPINEGPWPAWQLPAHDQLADNADELDWDRSRDGRMVEHAADNEPTTTRWEG